MMERWAEWEELAVAPPFQPALLFLCRRFTPIARETHPPLFVGSSPSSGLCPPLPPNRDFIAVARRLARSTPPVSLVHSTYKSSELPLAAGSLCVDAFRSECFTGGGCFLPSWVGLAYDSWRAATRIEGVTCLIYRCRGVHPVLTVCWLVRWQAGGRASDTSGRMMLLAVSVLLCTFEERGKIQKSTVK